MSDLVGCRLGEYQVLRRLGQRGMADVYAARHLTLQRDVALKVLREQQTGDEENVKRFRREAQAAARLNHPSIVQVYEIGQADGKHFIAQELIDGVNLRQWLEQNGAIGVADATEILLSVCDALQTAHESGVTHRDIKPENIMRRSDAAIKVTDFGLARMLTKLDSSTANLTRAGLTLGTPRYMSPEQIQGHAVDARSDLYSLGVTIYHLLTGTPPFEADEPLALAVQHLHDTPKPLDHARGQTDLPAWLVALVMRLLQKDPDARLASAAEVLELIRYHCPDLGSSQASQSAVGTNANQENDTTKQSQQPTLTPVAVRSTGLPGSNPTAQILGVNATTTLLQRETDNQAKRFRSRWRRRLVGTTLAILSGAAGYMIAARSASKSLAGVLRGPVVARADTIEQQYVLAITRDDAPAWRAIGEYFPDAQDTTSVDYRHKAKLQLARTLVEQKDFVAAEEVLDELQQSTSVKRLYRIIAAVIRHQLAERSGRERLAASLKTQVQRMIDESRTENPKAIDTLRVAIPADQDWVLALLP